MRLRGGVGSAQRAELGRAGWWAKRFSPRWGRFRLTRVLPGSTICLRAGKGWAMRVVVIQGETGQGVVDGLEPLMTLIALYVGDVDGARCVEVRGMLPRARWALAMAIDNFLQGEACGGRHAQGLK